MFVMVAARNKPAGIHVVLSCRAYCVCLWYLEDCAGCMSTVVSMLSSNGKSQEKARKRARTLSMTAIHQFYGTAQKLATEADRSDLRKHAVNRIAEATTLLDALLPSLMLHNQPPIHEKVPPHIDAAANLMAVQQASLSSAMHARRMRRRLMSSLLASSTVVVAAQHPPSRNFLPSRDEVMDSFAKDRVRRRATSNVTISFTDTSIDKSPLAKDTDTLLSLVCIDVILRELCTGA
jgi:hypothetical protein